MLDNMKKISRKLYVKIIVFVLMLAFAVGLVDSIGRLVACGPVVGGWTNQSYLESDTIAYDMNQYIDYYVSLNFDSPSDEDIENGAFITQEDMINAISDSYYEWSGLSQEYFTIGYDKKNKEYTIKYNISEEELTDYYGTDEGKPNFADYLNQNPDLEIPIKYQMINDAAQRKADLESWLTSNDHGIDVLYLGSDTKDIKSKIEETTEEFKQYPIYFIQKNGIRESNNEWLENCTQVDATYFDYGKETILFGMNQDHIDQIEKTWTESRNNLLLYGSYGSACFVGIFICFIYLCVVVGRRENETEIYLNWFDHIWTEIQLFIGSWGVILSIAAGVRVLEEISRSLSYTTFYGVINAIVTVIGGTILASVLLSQVKRLKAHKFWDGFICIKLLKKIGKGIADVWRGGPRMCRIVLLIAAAVIISATVVGAVIVLPVALYFAYKYIKDFEIILEGLEKVKGGQLDHKIDTELNGDLSDLAEGINSISEGLKNSVSQEFCSERLKSDMIYNVTNEMQVPLNTIVTCVDQLKKEEIENESTIECIAALDQKSKQLKRLSNDLYKATQASSGNMEVELAPVDFNAFLAEEIPAFEDKLEEAQLFLKLTLPEHPVNIMADRNLLNQVFQTIMSNVVKYAMKNSRVYLSVEEINQQIIFNLKNVSATALNTSVGEIAEDTEDMKGSGLGLSIAKSLIELQQGVFKVIIDGDLYKIVIKFPKQ